MAQYNCQNLPGLLALPNIILPLLHLSLGPTSVHQLFHYHSFKAHGHLACYVDVLL
jgi:hypothetical protein